MALAHEAYEAPVVDGDLMLGAAFAAEAEQELAIAHELHVAVAQGRQPKRLVGAGVFLVPHADERSLQEAHHRSEHPLTREAEPSADLLERLRLGVVEPVAEDEDLAFPLLERQQCGRQGLRAKRDLDLFLR